MKKNTIILVLLFLAILSIVLSNSLSDFDEIWNFNFAKNIAENRLPYKDFNMIQGPLLPIIASVFLRIFGIEMVVMRALAVILCTMIIFLVYKILELVKVHKYVLYTSIFFVYFILLDHLRIDYNFATILVVLTALYYELKRLIKTDKIIEYNFQFDFILGILIGHTILLKHTTGLVISVAFVFYKFLLIFRKEDLKTIMKITGTRFLGVLIPVAILIVYLIINNIFSDFLDYCIYSIKTFSNYIEYKSLFGNESIVIQVLSYFVPISLAYMVFKCIIKRLDTTEDRILFTIFPYSVSAFIIAFPISDEIHFLVGSIPGIIAIIYIFWIETLKLKNNKIFDKFILGLEYYARMILVCTTVLVMVYSIGSFRKYVLDKNNYTDLKHFKYIRSDPGTINMIGSFILQKEKQGRKVYILDAIAAMYMIPIDRYNKDYDMFLKGNIGSKGEEGQIEKLNQEENVLVLIKKEGEGRNWQNPEEVRKYIIENWNKVDEIEAFDVYEK